MSVSKMKSIGYPLASVFDATDEKCLRMLVLWLEENILQTYESDKRSELQNIDSAKWDTAFKNYCVSCSSPITSTETIDNLEWLLGMAVRKVYNEQKSNFDSKTKTTLEISSDVSMIIQSDNPVDHLDVYSNDFKEGVEKLADLLNICKHPDHIITFEAIHTFIEKRLSAKAIKNPSAVLPKGEAFPLEQIKGHKIDSKDPDILKALKVLRLAQLHRLRDLQTCINECIVSMQQITSDPKTDTKLGKVGH